MMSVPSLAALCRRLSLAVLLSLLPGLIVAQASPTGPEGAPVVIGGDTLFRLYGSLGPFTPAQRAEAVTVRLRAAAPAIARGIDTLQVIESAGHSEILAGDQVLMTVVDGDALPTGLRRDSVALEYAERIAHAAREMASRLSLRAILTDVLYAVLATLGLITVLALLASLFRKLYRFLQPEHLPALHLQRFELLSAGRLAVGLTLVARTFRLLLTLVVSYAYLTLVLSLFPWTAPYARRISGYALAPFRVIGQNLLEYLPNLFYLLIIALVIRYALRVLRSIFSGLARGALVIRGFHRDWGIPTYKIVRFMVVALGLVLMVPYLPGSQSNAFKGISIFLGVLFSFGSSSAVGNLMAGVVLTYTRAFQIGDRVQIGGTIGDVVERTLLVTRLRTIKNEEVTIPNGTVLNGHVINFSIASSDHGLVLHTSVTIGYDAPWRTVHQLLTTAALETDLVSPEPEPFVLQTALNDFYVSYEINAYTRHPAKMAEIYSHLHQNIQDQFNRAGLEIMSPHYRAVRDGNEPAMPAASSRAAAAT